MGMKLKLGTNKTVSLYSTLLFFFVIISIINSSVLPIGKIYYAYNALCIVACLFLFFRSKKTIKLHLLSIVLLITFTVTTITTNNLTMLVFAFFIITAEKDFSILVRTVFIGTLLGLLFVIMLAVVGIIPDYTYLHLGQTVHSYGFYYYSSIPYYLLFTSLMYLYLKGKNIKILEIITIFLIQYVSYKIFTVRLTFYVGVLIISLTLLFIKMRVGNLNRRVIKGISAILFPMAAIISCIACLEYKAGDPLWSTINSVFSNRISQGNYAFTNYSVKLFGQQIEMQGRAALALGLYSGHYFYIDSGYVYSVLVYGMVFTIVLLYVYSMMMVKICQINNKQLYIWLVAVLVFSVMNNALININMNPLLLCIPYLFQKGSFNQEIEK